MTDTHSSPTVASDTAVRTSRRSLLAGAGVLAACAGVGVAWWSGSHETSGASQGEPLPGFWSLQWDMPQGGVLKAQDLRGKPLLVNFWATWCPPCIEELPLINDFYKKNQANGWQVVGLAIDRPDAVRGFLQKLPLDFPVGLASAGGAELARGLGNPSGSLPFSVAVNAQGGVAQRKLGRLHPEDLATWAQLK